MIEDDVYAELHYDAHPPVSAKAFDRKGLVLSCGSFSKCLAPGYRVGWVAAGRYVQQLTRAKIMSTLSTAVPSQQALAEYLAHGGYERHLRRLRRTLARQSDLASRLATRLFPSGTRLSRPQGGYFLWVEFPEHVDTLRLHAQALDRGISTAPGRMFSARAALRPLPAAELRSPARSAIRARAAHARRSRRGAKAVTHSRA